MVHFRSSDKAQFYRTFKQELEKRKQSICRAFTWSEQNVGFEASQVSEVQEAEGRITFLFIYFFPLL